jgi:5'(3')-deoxyribonucleotidase
MRDQIWDKQKIVYVDMDDVLCDFAQMYNESKERHPEIAYPHSVPETFLNLTPIDGAIEGFRSLSANPKLDVYILSAPSVFNPHSYTEKRLWVERHLGLDAAHRLILSPHKHLNHGDFLVDDQLDGRGQERFSGELLHFGSEQFPNWPSIVDHIEIRTVDLGGYIIDVGPGWEKSATQLARDLIKMGFSPSSIQSRDGELEIVGEGSITSAVAKAISDRAAELSKMCEFCLLSGTPTSVPGRCKNHEK